MVILDLYSVSERSFVK